MINPETKQAIITLRQQGETFAVIGKLLSLSPNTVKSVCHRSGIPAGDTAAGSDVCKNCRKPLTQIPGRKEKTFCSTHCRTAWWNKTRSRKPYRLTCYCCGREFISFGNRKKKFCSPECYRVGRYGKGLP